MRSCLTRAALAVITSTAAFCQAPTGGVSGHSRARTLPISGQLNQPGSVQTNQTVTSGSDVSTINSSVQVSGNLQGSVPAASLPGGPISLTLYDAVKRGLASNLGQISAANSLAEARAERMQSLGELLPRISLNASETVTQVNLAAYGLKIQAPAGSNFAIPTIVGPYSYSQLQGTVSASVFDLVQRRNYKSSKVSEQVATLSSADTRELVVLAVAGTYLQTLALSSRLTSQRAQVANAEAIYNQASVRKAAGTNAKIDVMRSLVEFQTQQQRLGSLEGDLRKQKIGLARLIGLPLDRELRLSEDSGSSLRVEDTVVPDADASIQKALQHRYDLKAGAAQVTAAELTLSAARAERYPTVSLNGNYGVIGPNPASTHGVFAVTGGVSMPLWEGGRIKADIQQAEAALQQRRAEFVDQRGKVESEVRNALIELETARGQLRLAASNRDYANETLSEARDRFNAGISTTVEVVQAQEQVAGAESAYIASVFSLNLAKLGLARATGQAESSLTELFKSGTP